MTEKDAIKQLKAIGDAEPEEAHKIADAVLCDLLQSLGYKRVVKEWLTIDRWYA